MDLESTFRSFASLQRDFRVEAAIYADIASPVRERTQADAEQSFYTGCVEMCTQALKDLNAKTFDGKQAISLQNTFQVKQAFYLTTEERDGTLPHKKRQVEKYLTKIEKLAQSLKAV